MIICDSTNNTIKVPQENIKGLHNPTCQPLPISSKRKVKMGWEEQESDRGGVQKLWVKERFKGWIR
jgi:hypothetical protein